MARAILLLFVALIALLLSAGPAQAQNSAADSLIDFQLSGPPSAFEWGCFAPCMCPVMIQSPLVGTFTLRRRTDPNPAQLYTVYDVSNVQWKASGGLQPATITGAGTYRWGGEVALLDQLTLDLSFNGGPSQHFDSGLEPVRAVFPEIDTRISLHGEYCRDSVLIVDAKGLSVAGVGGGATTASMRAAPSPFGASTRIAFTLPRAGPVQLAVFDVTGRQIRLLADHEWFASGPGERTWDGRLDNGAVARPGVYFVRLDSPAARMNRAVAKVR
jgi:hypothetical protein